MALGRIGPVSAAPAGLRPDSRGAVLRRKKLLEDYESGVYDARQLCEIAGLSRSAMYATLQRAREDRERDEVA